MNREIEIVDYKIAPSNKVGVFGDAHKDCLHMQVKHQGRYYIVFTSSKYLMEELQSIEKQHYPIMATIEEVEMRYKLA